MDVGSKAIAADPAGDRGRIVGFPEAKPGSQSEEHWVFQSDGDDIVPVGEAMLIAPAHVCPTVNLYEEALIVDSEGLVTGSWRIVARSRKLTI